MTSAWRRVAVQSLPAVHHPDRQPRPTPPTTRNTDIPLTTRRRPGLCVSKSRFTCSGSRSGSSFGGCEDEEDGRGYSLLQALCRDQLAPRLDERYRASAAAACMRPMYELLDQPLGLTNDLHFRLAVGVYGFGLLLEGSVIFLTIR